MSGIRVGFIGLGSMGGTQARCLAARGFALTVLDVHPSALQAFADNLVTWSSIVTVPQADRAFQQSQAGIGDKDLQPAAEFARSVGADIPVFEQARAYLPTAMLGD